MSAEEQNNARDSWGSRLAFILAAAGSAIGLGNIWRFPMTAAESGGGAFVVIYLLCVFFVAMPVMLAEMVVGRAGEKNPVGAMKHLKPRTPWFLIGLLGVLTAIVVLSYYSVVAGWTIYYFFQAAAGTFVSDLQSPQEFKDFFGSTAASPGISIVFHAIFIVATIWIVGSGVQRGIERTIKVVMPIFFVLLLLLTLRSLTLEDAEKGIAYYIQPDFSQITGGVVVAALGQAFFSLSLGMGAIITYGSYLSKRESLPNSAFFVTLMDTVIALVSGLLIFPAMFFAHLPPTQAGPGLIFQVLPQVFAQMPGAPWGGIIFGSAFFLLLGLAAVTSAISLLEVVVAYFVDEHQIQRKKVAWLMGGVIFLVGIPSALSSGAVDSLSAIPGIGMDLLTLLDTIFGSFALTIGALGLCIFVAWAWGLAEAIREISQGEPEFRFEPIWRGLIRYAAPIAIIGILISLLIPSAGWGIKEISWSKVKDDEGNSALAIHLTTQNRQGDGVPSTSVEGFLVWFGPDSTRGTQDDTMTRISGITGEEGKVTMRTEPFKKGRYELQLSGVSGALNAEGVHPYRFDTAANEGADSSDGSN